MYSSIMVRVAGLHRERAAIRLFVSCWSVFSFVLALLCLLAASAVQSSAQSVEFQAINGDRGSQCSGIGMCRVSLAQMSMMSLSSRAAVPSQERMVAVQAQFSMQSGRLVLTLTDLRSQVPMTASDVKDLPLDASAKLPTTLAHALGFSSVTVLRGTYEASSVGVFPLQAQFSFGLSVSPNPSVGFPARLQFEALQAMVTSVYVYDRSGTRVATLSQKQKIESGSAPELLWDGTMLNGAKAGRGSYVVELRVQLPGGGSFAETQTLVVGGGSFAETQTLVVE
jgi:hypothetical protein